MKRNRFAVEQIIRMFREAEVHLSQVKGVKLVSRELGGTEQTCYRWEAQVVIERWRKEYNTTPRVRGR
jgi:hypothetical protein